MFHKKTHLIQHKVEHIFTLKMCSTLYSPIRGLEVKNDEINFIFLKPGGCKAMYCRTHLSIPKGQAVQYIIFSVPNIGNNVQ